MIRKLRIGLWSKIISCTLILAVAQANALFVSKGRSRAIHAVATVTEAATLTIDALPLASDVFPGKHLVIPVQVTSNEKTITTNNLRVDVVYQVLDPSGSALTAPATIPVQFQPDPTNSARIRGVAYVPRSELSGLLTGGQLKYFFRVISGASGIYLGGGTGGRSIPYPSAAGAAALESALVNAYKSNVVTSMEGAVYPTGASVFAQDMYENDGSTGLRLDAGAVANPGTLRIDLLNLAQIPSGPGGSRPVTAYNFTLLGTSLQKPAQIVLSYAADLDGRMADSGGNPSTLAPYWWDGINWRLLSRPKIDTTLHTVTGYLPSSGGSGSSVQTIGSAPLAGSNSQHFEGTFALFPVGNVSAVDLRPTERIITPNGDGVNDTATFSGLTDTDEVHIFDIRGRRVRSLRGTNGNARWDGRDDGGSIVESGVYVYQFTSQGSRVSGVIAVAK